MEQLMIYKKHFLNLTKPPNLAFAVVAVLGNISDHELRVILLNILIHFFMSLTGTVPLKHAMAANQLFCNMPVHSKCRDNEDL